MQLPAYWWLLALSILIQGAFFVRFYIVRMRSKRVQPLSRTKAAVVYASGAAGLAYGVAQSDPLFFVGQAALLAFLYRMQQIGHDELH